MEYRSDYPSIELEELLRVHFPGSGMIIERSGGWDGLELGFPKWNVSRENWALSGLPWL
jgi:hypothetical protein